MAADATDVRIFNTSKVGINAFYYQGELFYNNIFVVRLALSLQYYDFFTWDKLFHSCVEVLRVLCREYILNVTL